MATSTDTLIEALVSHLQTDLPALVAAEGLPAVKRFTNHHPPQVNATQTPEVWVDIGADVRSDEPSRGGTLHKYSHRPSVLVGVSYGGPDGSAAARGLRKLVDLVRRCVEGDQTVGGSLWVSWQRTDYTNNMATQAGGLFQIAYLTFDCNRRTRIGGD